jgi:hypothetical protein
VHVRKCNTQAKNLIPSKTRTAGAAILDDACASQGGVTMPDESHAEHTPGTPPAMTDDHIKRLLRNADRLSFGVRPPGFVLINRARLLAAHGITQANARLIDRWVSDAGGGVQPLRRATPESRPVRKYNERRKRPDTIVWGIPAKALRVDADRG